MCTYTLHWAAPCLLILRGSCSYIDAYCTDYNTLRSILYIYIYEILYSNITTTNKYAKFGFREFWVILINAASI